MYKGFKQAVVSEEIKPISDVRSTAEYRRAVSKNHVEDVLYNLEESTDGRRMKKKLIEFTINGKPKKLYVKTNELLLNVIRGDLGLTGVKYGCGTGECGACTVLIDEEPVLSCLTLAVTVDKKKITTIEGIGTDENPHPLQQTFVETGAIQCGFCTPGMILSAKALLDKNPNPTEDEIKRAIEGNLCRCTGYVKIIEAVKLAAEYIGRGKNNLWKGP